ncbi:dihydropteroate synthase [Furfurilactobacillus curtus]|uniref:Dihydropteroate synthase n=1 Tax=Furfurilactobacillus curtus TaxID=1746200 RepID=A0ABQ5JQ97_9LACO
MIVTTLTSPAKDLAGIALKASLERQEKLALSFSELTESERQQLMVLLDNLDAIVVSSPMAVETLIDNGALLTLTTQLHKQFHQATVDQAMIAIREAREVHWRAGRFDFKTSSKPVIYGILNVTPDSFYDGGRYQEPTAVLNHVTAMVEAGADVIEIGGQTTRPGFTPIDATTEMTRVVPLLRAIKQHFPEVAIAVDTYKYPVMKAVLDEGVDIINDVNAFTDDPAKLTLLAPQAVGLLTMHASRGKEYQNLTQAMSHFFSENLAALTAAGIDRERIALDQGIGYAKIADGYQDFTMMRNLDRFLNLKRPLMIAISRKGFGHKLFGLAKDDRLSVTLVAEAYMYLHGGRILRVHDVSETVQLVKLLQTIEQSFWFPDREEPRQV